MTKSALDGVRILDLTSEMGWYCGKLLADLGADVIKVEPVGGDPSRGRAPFWQGVPGRETSLRFWYFNANKRSVTLDLGQYDGRWLFGELVKTADIVIESWTAAERAELAEHDVDPDAYIWQLAVGERQRVEIMKAIYRDVSLLILDEPTSVLTPAEVEDLFVTLRQMTEGGRGLVFISHKLHEVMSLSDRITVLRGGRVTGRTVPSETSREQLAHMMVGREVRLAPNRSEADVADARLTISALEVLGDRGTPAVTDFDLEVRSGEVVGIAGVSGNGQRELAEALAGLRPVASGTIVMNGVDTTAKTPKEIRRLGVSYIPEERMRDGAIGEFSVAENLILTSHDLPPTSRRGFLNFKEIETGCSDLVRRFTVKTPSLETPTANLSGGNIQKLIIARELSGEPEVLIASQPTRGVDIGAAEYIHTVLMDQRAGGIAILLISEDLDEVIGLSDRIAVMFEGRIMGTLDQEEATVQRLGLLMAGVSEGEE